MYKKIPGNLDYSISLNKTIVDQYGQIVNLEQNDRETISIELFGAKRKVSKTWLSLLAWYDAGYINNLHEYLDKIKFYHANENLSIRCKFVMVFTEPITYKKGYRYIPCFPRYAMNNEGVIVDTTTNRIVDDYSVFQGYSVIYLYTPDKISNRNQRVHRLVALTWIPNIDFVNRPIVNHINGDRSDNRIVNLEWCSYEYNANYALETGLNKSSIVMKSRDFLTGEVVVYTSLSEMASKLGMNVATTGNYLNKLPGFLYKKRYEIKVGSDDSPWYYEENPPDPSGAIKAIFTISVFNKITGDIRKFNNVKTFYKTYNIWVKSCKIDDAIIAFRNKYKDLDVSYIRNSLTGPYNVLDLETNTTYIVDAIWKAAELIGRTRTELQFDLSRSLKFIYSKRWIVAPSLNEIIQTEYKDKPKPFNSIEITKKDGSKIIANSIRHAIKLTGIQGRTISKYLGTGKVCTKGNIYRPLE